MAPTETRIGSRRRRFARVEAKKTEFLARLDTLDEARATRAPSPDDWSPRQVIHHLVRAEEALHAPDPNVPTKLPLVFFLGCALLRTAIPLASRAREEPSNTTSSRELASRWDAARATLRAGLETAPPGTRHAIHPVFGPIDLDSYLVFLDAHLTYHLKRWPKT